MPDNRLPTRRRWLLPALLLFAAAVATLGDFQVALAFRRWDANPSVGPYLGWFDYFELYGHGLGLVFILFILHQLDPSKRWAIPRIAFCALGAGGLADLVKMTVVRIRPNDFSFQGSIWASFGNWLPMIGQSSSQSFPSAHTALACGLSVALVWLYPQGRLLFTLLAALVACQRVVAGAHFPSDVLAGAAVGVLTATLILHVGLLPRWCAWVESSWRPAT